MGTLKETIYNPGFPEKLLLVAQPRTNIQIGITIAEHSVNQNGQKDWRGGYFPYRFLGMVNSNGKFIGIIVRMEFCYQFCSMLVNQNVGTESVSALCGVLLAVVQSSAKLPFSRLGFVFLQLLIVKDVDALWPSPSSGNCHWPKFTASLYARVSSLGTVCIWQEFNYEDLIPCLNFEIFKGLSHYQSQLQDWWKLPLQPHHSSTSPSALFAHSCLLQLQEIHYFSKKCPKGTVCLLKNMI